MNGIFGERITLRKTVLILIALIGAVLIGVKDYLHIFNWRTGEFAALLSAISFSIGYVSRKWHTQFLNNKEITILIFAISIIILFVGSILFGEGLPTGSWNYYLFGVVLIAGFFNVFNMFLANFGFEKVQISLASTILGLEGFFGVLLGLLFYSELLTAKELIGGVFIILSIILLNRRSKV